MLYEWWLGTWTKHGFVGMLQHIKQLFYLPSVLLLQPPVCERLLDAAEDDLDEGVLQPLDVLAAHVGELHVLVHPDGKYLLQHLTCGPN